MWTWRRHCRANAGTGRPWRWHACGPFWFRVWAKQAGASTNWCIRATAYGALERGYDLTLISNARTTRSVELDGGAKIEAASVITDLNVVMTWHSYPGRRNGTAKAEEIDFGALAAAKR